MSIRQPYLAQTKQIITEDDIEALAVDYLILRDANGRLWKLTVKTDGALDTINIQPQGQPIGILLGLTYF
jgi:hypothetical protein